MEKNVDYCNYSLMEGSVVIIRFEMENYACFDERVVFDFTTNERADKIDDGSDKLKIINGKKIIDVAGIFGTNGSGKSYILLGLSSVLNLLGVGVISDGIENAPKSHIPFAFDRQRDSMMSEFVLEFSVNEDVYLYSCGVYKDNLIYEELSLKIEESCYIIFKFDYYCYDENTKKYNRNDEFSSGDITDANREVLNKLSKNFDKNTGYLKTSIGNHTSFIYYMILIKSKDLDYMFDINEQREFAKSLKELILNIREYIYTTIYVENQYEYNDIRRVLRKFIDWTDGKNKLLNILKELDTTIEEIIFTKELRTKLVGYNDIGRVPPINKTITHKKEDLSGLIKIKRKYGDNERKLKLSWESKGTRRFVYMMMDILIVLNEGGVVLIDELDANFTYAVQNHIIALFKSKNENINNSQLIFNSQNHDILKNENMRLDEYYLAYRENNSCVASINRFLDFYEEDIIDIEDINFFKDFITNRFIKIPFTNRSY